MAGFVPAIQWPQRNTKAMEVALCDAVLFYSYTTLIGANLYSGFYRHSRVFSRTTNRHTHRDFGINGYKPVSEEELHEKVAEHMTEYFQNRLRKKFL